MTTWHRLTPDFVHLSQDPDDEQLVVPPFVAESSLVDLILLECTREVTAKGLPLGSYTREPTKKHRLDFGGIAWAHRKLFEIELDGLKLTVPAKDVADYFEMADARLGRKEFANSTVFEWLPAGDTTTFPVIAHHVPVHPVSLWLWPHQLDELHRVLSALCARARGGGHRDRCEPAAQRTARRGPEARPLDREAATGRKERRRVTDDKEALALASRAYRTRQQLEEEGSC